MASVEIKTKTVMKCVPVEEPGEVVLTLGMYEASVLRTLLYKYVTGTSDALNGIGEALIKVPFAKIRTKCRSEPTTDGMGVLLVYSN